MQINIRESQPADSSEIRQLFHDTVRRVNRRDYSPQQIDVWSAAAWDDALWHDRWRDHLIYVAEANKQIVGFAELVPIEQHLDCFYCHYQYQGKGVGTLMLNHVEGIARSLALPRLWTEASITARPFFQHRGFTVVRPQVIERWGVKFENFVMEKYL